MSVSALRRFFSCLLPFLFCCFLACLCFYLSDAYSKKMGILVSEAAGSGIFIKRVYILPFKGIELANIRFIDNTGQAMSIERITLQCSFGELFRKEIFLKRILIKNARISLAGNYQPNLLNRFSLNRYLSADKVSQTKKRNNFTFISDRATYCFDNLQVEVLAQEKSVEKKLLVLDFCADSQGGKISCEGRIDYKKSTLLAQEYGGYRFPIKHMRFNVNFEFLGSDIAVNKARFYSGPYAFSGSGIISNAVAKPNVDIQINFDPIRLENSAILKPLRPKGGELSIIAYLNGNPNDLRLRSEIIMPTIEFPMEKDILKLDQVYCQLVYNFKNNMLNVKEIKGIVDESSRFTATGTIADIFSPKINMRLELSDIVPAGTKEALKPYRRILTLQGLLKDGGYLGDASLLFTNENDRQYTFDLKGLTFTKDASGKKGQMVLRAKTVGFLEKKIMQGASEALQNFVFDQLISSITFVGKRALIDEAVLLGYGGKVALKGNLYFNKEKRECLINVKMDNLDLKNIKLTYPVYCEMSGIISGDLKIEEKKNINVEGSVAADHFWISKLEPLDKVADFIGINSIKEISDAQVVTDFNLSPETSAIKRFDLDSTEMRIRSDFSINTKKWIEGEIALSLSRATLEESKIFKTLISIARERNDQLDFVVHVSGFLWQLRTELVKSDFRDKLKDRISMGVQRYIQNEANKAIDDNSTR